MGVYKHRFSVVINKLKNNQRVGAAAPLQRPHGHTIAVAWCEGEVCVLTEQLPQQSQIP